MSPRDTALKVAAIVERPTEDTVLSVMHAYLMGSADERRQVVDLIVIALKIRGVP